MSSLSEVEDTQTTELSCPRCETVNTAQSKFCVKCGIPLWEACFQCGELCAAGENYCGSCGANIKALAAQLLEHAEATFEDVAELRENCRFDEAIALLSTIAKNTHPRMAENAARAKQLIRDLTAEHRERMAEARTAFERAAACVEAKNYQQAAEIVATVPQALRNEEFQSLHEKIRAWQTETTQLSDDLRRAIAEKRLLDLPPILDRLLAINPDDTFARKTAEQLRDRLMATAKKHIIAHDYDRAVELLEKVSLPVRTPQWEKMYRQVAEVSLLTWDLLNAPIIDKTLLATADRLQKLVPNDSKVVKLCRQLEQKVKESSGKLYPIPWAPQPKEMPLGVPVEWLHSFQRIKYASTIDASILTENAGRLAVACGLALAAITKNALKLNLLSNQNRSIWQNMKQMLEFGIAKSAWGIDVGPSGIRAVRLTWHGISQTAVIEDIAVVEHSKLLSHAGNETEEARLVVDSLEKVLQGRNLKGEYVCVGLPGRQTLCRSIDVPHLDTRRTKKYVQFEAQQQFDIPLDQLAWDFQPLGEGENRRVIMAATRLNTVRRFLEPFRRLRIRVNMLQTDYIAIHNFLMYDLFGMSEVNNENKKAVAVLDVGSETTNIIVSSPDLLWCHSCGVAGQHFTRALVCDLKFTTPQAETFKRQPESSQRLYEIAESLSPAFEDLLKDVRKSLAAYTANNVDRPVRCLFGLGGGFLTHGLFRYLRCGR